MVSVEIYVGHAVGPQVEQFLNGEGAVVVHTKARGLVGKGVVQAKRCRPKCPGAGIGPHHSGGLHCRATHVGRCLVHAGARHRVVAGDKAPLCGLKSHGQPWVARVLLHRPEVGGGVNARQAGVVGGIEIHHRYPGCVEQPQLAEQVPCQAPAQRALVIVRWVVGLQPGVPWNNNVGHVSSP